MPDAHLHLTAKRRELLNWFHANAAPLADAYEGALMLLGDPPFPGRLHFIAHAVRDISDRLIYVLDPQKPGSRVQYEDHLDGIEVLWKGHQVAAGAGETGPIETVAIGSKVASLIDRLVEVHRERRKRPSHYKLLIRYLMKGESSSAHVNERLVKDFKGVREWFM